MLFLTVAFAESLTFMENVVEMAKEIEEAHATHCKVLSRTHAEIRDQTLIGKRLRRSICVHGYIEIYVCL